MSWATHRDLIAGGRFLRVMNYHSTSPSTVNVVHRELSRLRDRFDPVDLTELDGFFATGRWSSRRPGLLPVFYEGYLDSLTVAAPACEDTGFVGWFPVCTGFLTCPVGDQEMFARSHWIELTAEDTAASAAGRRLAMTLDEAGELAQRHVVFPHTASHAAVSDVMSDDDLEREIVEPKRLLDAATGESSAAFVWMMGTPWGGHPRHDRAILDAGYRYVFSNTMIQRIR